MAIVSSLWIGDRLSPLERACVHSFLSRGHSFDLYAYGPLANVPAGCRVVDAATLLPSSQIIRYSRGPGKGSVALFSNMFRYRLLEQVGGWFLRADKGLRMIPGDVRDTGTTYEADLLVVRPGVQSQHIDATFRVEAGKITAINLSPRR